MEHSKKTTREEYQKCVNAVVDYINLHLGEEIDLKSLAKISHFSPFYFCRPPVALLGFAYCRYRLSHRLFLTIVTVESIQAVLWNFT